MARSSALIYYLPRVSLLGKKIEIVISSRNGEDLDSQIRVYSNYAIQTPKTHF
jgi:sRNA-binding regulator protein Hfq